MPLKQLGSSHRLLVSVGRLEVGLGDLVGRRVTESEMLNATLKTKLSFFEANLM